MKTTIEQLNHKKTNHVPIAMITAYDYAIASIQDSAGVDSILVGDSVGTNYLGYTTEQEVTMADMLHHVGAVARGTKQAYLIADMPFASTVSEGQSLDNARLLIAQGADCVKLEGWREKCKIVSHLTKNNIAVCAHIGYNPQIHGSKPRTFGKAADQALELIESAKILQDAGAVMIVIEKVPEEISKIISELLRIPVIGIGCGKWCDGQVLVVNDLLGMSENTFKHARRYMDFYGASTGAFKSYKSEVQNRVFPGEENTWHIPEDELLKVKEKLSIESNQKGL